MVESIGGCRASRFLDCGIQEPCKSSNQNESFRKTVCWCQSGLHTRHRPPVSKVCKAHDCRRPTDTDVGAGKPRLLPSSEIGLDLKPIRAANRDGAKDRCGFPAPRLFARVKHFPPVVRPNVKRPLSIAPCAPQRTGSWDQFSTGLCTNEKPGLVAGSRAR